MENVERGKMFMSHDGYRMLMLSEGLNVRQYINFRGLKAIGYGHKLTAHMYEVINIHEALELLITDVNAAGAWLNRYKLNLKQNEFDALIMLIFDISIESFMGTALFTKLILDEQKSIVANEFVKPMRIDRDNAILVKQRRALEQKLFLTGKYRL